MRRVEFDLMKRKELRDKGEYWPDVPPYTPSFKSHFHALDQANQASKAANANNDEKKVRERKMESDLDNFLGTLSAVEKKQR